MFALPNAGSRVLYHIGKRPAKPEPYRLDLAQGWSHRKSGYVPAPHEKVVFLTPSPATVAANHGIPKGHVYAYEVPHSVVKALGGINVLDQAPEIAIPERLWGQVRFLGRSETDTVQFHRESASQRLPRPRWRLDIRFPREVREARHQFWQQAMRGLGLRHAPSEAWLNHPESDNTPFLWPRLLAKHLREAYPEACRRLLEQAGKGGTVRSHFDLLQEVNKKPLLPRAVPDMNDRLARLLFPNKFTSLILRRLDLLLLAGSRHPGRKPPRRA